MKLTNIVAKSLRIFGKGNIWNKLAVNSALYSEEKDVIKFYICTHAIFKSNIHCTRNGLACGKPLSTYI